MPVTVPTLQPRLAPAHVTVLPPPARSVVVPMYQEAGRIEASVAALADSVLRRADTEVLLVDDGSTDGTAELALRALRAGGLRGRVVVLPRNVGKGGAIRAGVAAATGRAVAFVDADLSAPPEAIDESLAVVEAGGADVVVTTRAHEVEPPLLRRAGSAGFSALLRQLGIAASADTQSGLKAFTADAARLLFGDLRIQRFAFDVEILLRAEVAGLRVVELPIAWRHVDADSRVRPLRDGARMAVDVVRLRRRLRAWQGTGLGPSTPLLARLEREHWWYAARRDLLVDALVRVGAAPGGRALEVGCGTGAVLDALAGLGFEPLGTDTSRSALGAVGRGGVRAPAVVAADPERLPLPEASVEVVCALDVVDTLDDDAGALAAYARVLRPGGTLVVTAAAGPWAWSAYDVALGHRRRYRRGELDGLVVAAGLEVVRTTSYHSWLVPLTFAFGRTPLRSLLRPPEEATFVAPRVNRVLERLARGERALTTRVPLPVGLSVLVVARRPT